MFARLTCYKDYRLEL